MSSGRRLPQLKSSEYRNSNSVSMSEQEQPRVSKRYANTDIGRPMKRTKTILAVVQSYLPESFDDLLDDPLHWHTGNLASLEVSRMSMVAQDTYYTKDAKWWDDYKGQLHVVIGPLHKMISVKTLSILTVLSKRTPCAVFLHRGSVVVRPTRIDVLSTRASPHDAIVLKSMEYLPVVRMQHSPRNKRRHFAPKQTPQDKELRDVLCGYKKQTKKKKTPPVKVKKEKPSSLELDSINDLT